MLALIPLLVLVVFMIALAISYRGQRGRGSSGDGGYIPGVSDGGSYGDAGHHHSADCGHGHSDAGGGGDCGGSDGGGGGGSD